MLHLLDLQLQRVERSEDLLHAIVIVLVVGVHGGVVHHLACVDVPTRSALGGSMDGEWVDDVTRGALLRREK